MNQIDGQSQVQTLMLGLLERYDILKVTGKSSKRNETPYSRQRSSNGTESDMVGEIEIEAKMEVPNPTPSSLNALHKTPQPPYPYTKQMLGKLQILREAKHPQHKQPHKNETCNCQALKAQLLAVKQLLRQQQLFIKQLLEQ